MTQKKAEETVDLGLKAGAVCNVIKVHIKTGKKSKVKLGVRKITLWKKPAVGEPLYSVYESEYPMSGDPRIVKHPVSSNIQKIRKINGSGLSIETETSILFIQKLD